MGFFCQFTFYVCLSGVHSGDDCSTRATTFIPLDTWLYRIPLIKSSLISFTKSTSIAISGTFQIIHVVNNLFKPELIKITDYE